MNNFTSTQLANFLQRANCCFADLAYKSTKAFAIGNFDKGYCEFQKAESLFHYIDALRCFYPEGSEICEEAVPACGMLPGIYTWVTPVFGHRPDEVNFNVTYSLDSITIGANTYNPVIIQNTLQGFVDQIVSFIGSQSDTLVATAVLIASPYYELYRIFVCDYAGESANGTEVVTVVTITTNDPNITNIPASQQQEIVPNLIGGSGGDSTCFTVAEGFNCVTPENMDILIEKARKTCPYCCDCTDFDYELTNDTL